MREVEREGSSTASPAWSTALDHFPHAAERAGDLPGRAENRWHRAGVSPRAERWLDLGGRALVAALVLGWSWNIYDLATHPHDPTRIGATASVAAALTNTDARSTAYLTDATLRLLSGEMLGASGKLRIAVRQPGQHIGADSVAGGADLRVEDPAASGSDVAPQSGIWRLAVAVGNALRPVADLNLVTLRPRADKQNGRVGLYYLGNWPGETGGRVNAPRAAPADRYRPPSGFIEVTPENADTRVSEHFTLRNFLTHDQANVWPKYIVLEMRNVDKLELVLSDLASRGIDVSGVTVMSGFRTPQYNKGGGDPTGRAGLSRHMYGDAADIFIDSNHDGVMDDLNHDGRSDIADARVISAAVDRVEAAHPELVGGAGVYPAESGHGPFIHIDSRGYRARWVGSGGG